MTAKKLLALELSSQTGSVALAVGDVLHARRIATPREQTGRVMGLLRELLDATGCALGDLDALVLGRGPGSFTGLRVAAGVIQGLSLAAGTPIVSVSSLAALALDGLEQHPAIDQALCVVDARMGEVYSALYRRDGAGVALAGDERLSLPEAIAMPPGTWLAVGDALSAHRDPLAGVLSRASAVLPEACPRAEVLLRLAPAELAAGRLLPLEAALPVYLREADAWHRS